MTKLNRQLTKQQLEDIESNIRAGEMTRQAAADLVGVTGPVMCRWISDGRPLWKRYARLVEYTSGEPLATRTVQTPEWGIQTFAFCAEKLKISLQSFAKRMRKHGPESPRTWVVGKLVENSSTPGSDNFIASQEWGKLGNNPRDHVLKRIPEPTKYERRLYGKDFARI